jgi:hypothetical protein
MTLLSSAWLGALVGAISFPFILGDNVSTLAAVALGVIGGALAAVAQHAVWGEAWESDAERRRAGRVNERRRHIQASAKHTLRWAVISACAAALVLVTVWLTGGRVRPQAVLLFLPSLFLVTAYLYSRWYDWRLPK